MATLTYDFEADSTGSMPSGWSVLDYIGTNICEVIVGKYFKVGGDTGGGATCNCTDVPTDVSDIDVTVSFQRSVVTTSASIALKVTGSTYSTWTGYQIKSNNTNFVIQKVDRSTNPELAAVATVVPTAQWWKMRAQIAGTTIRAKLWLASDSEPGTWTLSTTDSTYTTGSTCLNVGVTAVFDDISIESDDIGTSIQAGLGSIGISGYNPVVSVPTAVGAGTGGLAVAGYGATISAPIIVTTGSIVIAGYNPTVSAQQPQTATLWFKFKDADGAIKSFNIGRRPSVQTVTVPGGDPPESFTEVNDDVVLVDATSNPADIRLPQATGREGFIYWIKKIDSSANAVVITPVGAETIDDAATQTLSSQHEVISVVSDGSDWWII